MSTTYDTILRLRAIRQYADRPVEPEDLRRVLEAARWTGSAKNRQNWSIIVVEDREQLDRLAGCASFAGPLSKAPVALALVQEGSTYGFDMGRMAQNIMLAASAIGMVSCPITLHNNEKAHKVLAIPEGRRCRYAIALGYPSPASRPAKAGGRKPLEEITHHNSYGGLAASRRHQQKAAKIARRETGASRRALPHHHLSWFGAWSAIAGLMPGIGASLP